MEGGLIGKEFYVCIFDGLHRMYKAEL
jgi:hypothetical protein